MVNRLILKFLFFIISQTTFISSVEYNHENFVFCSNSKDSFALSNEIKNIAHNANSFLNCSKFFDTELISNSKDVQNELAKDPTHKEVEIITEDNQKLICSYFDHKKNKIIIIGPGFTNAKEKMVPFAHMFDDYDILIMNYRGHGYKKEISLNPVRMVFGVDSTIKLVEEKDVFAVIRYARNLKEYKNVIGLGVCLGAYVFAKTQSIADQTNVRAFDKIILDGCWISLNSLIEKIKKDPNLIFDPQKGGASQEMRWLFSKRIFSDFVANSAMWYFGLQLGETIINYVKYIKTPTLFFYGKDDLTISRDEFECIWENCINPNKVAIITSNPHVRNHLMSKELYKLITELFIENDINKFTELLADPKKLTSNLIAKFEEQLQNQKPNFIKPNKVQRTISFRSSVFSYKIPALFFASLYAGYKNRLVNWQTFTKFAKAYAVYKFIQISWRPAIKILARI